MGHSASEIGATLIAALAGRVKHVCFAAGQFEREGYKFDVGSSMMFGLSKKPCGTNLITQALDAVGKSVDIIPDPTQLEYHLPKSDRFPDGLNIKVWCDYERFLDEMYRLFPNEKKGIKGFYDECWRVCCSPHRSADQICTRASEASGSLRGAAQIFNSLNSMELRSLEELRFLMSQFVKAPLSCLTLATYFVTNTGDTARKHISDPELLRVIDIECYCWSTVLADATPLINAGMVLCDRFYGGINYPRGGVGGISRLLAEGLEVRRAFQRCATMAVRACTSSLLTSKIAKLYAAQANHADAPWWSCLDNPV